MVVVALCAVDVLTAVAGREVMLVLRSVVALAVFVVVVLGVVLCAEVLVRTEVLVLGAFTVVALVVAFSALVVLELVVVACEELFVLPPQPASASPTMIVIVSVLSISRAPGRRLSVVEAWR